MLPPFFNGIFCVRCRDPKSALTLATRLYEEAMLVPYMVRISIFYRENYPRAWVNTLRIYCMTDDKAEKVRYIINVIIPLGRKVEYNNYTSEI